MPKIVNIVGEQFGVWKVIQKTQDKGTNGSYLYECINTDTGEKSLKTSGYLKQFKRRNSVRSTVRGRPRKWIITRVPYVEKKI